MVEQVDRASLESQVLFYDPVVSARPLTAAELGDTSGAVPVRMEIMDTIAVAWLAPNGVPQFDHAGIVAIFPIASSADGFGDITPATDTTHSVPTIPHATNPGGIGVTGGSTTSPTTIGGRDVPVPGLLGGLTGTFLRWQALAGANTNIIRQIGSYHPGCG